MSNQGDLYQVDDAVPAEYKKFKLGRKYRWVMFGLEVNGNDRKHVVKEVESDRSKDLGDLVNALPQHDCRYVVFEYEYKTKDGRKTDKLFFIQWSPRAAATHIQMDYLTGRPNIRALCDGCFDLSATTGADVHAGIIGDGKEGSDDDMAEDNDDSWLDN